MVEAGGGIRFAYAVLGDPNALRFGTRRRTRARENSPPDYFPNRTQPSQGSTPPTKKKTAAHYGAAVFFGGGGPSLSILTPKTI